MAFKYFPAIVDDGRTVTESSVIIEHRGLRYPGPVQLIPEDPATALEVRFMDRFVSTPQQKVVLDSMRAPEQRDPQGVAEAKRMLETGYRWLDEHMAAAGDDSALADCAAAPALFYADWTHRIGKEFTDADADAYRQRLLARPSFARAVDKARPYRLCSRSAPRTATDRKPVFPAHAIPRKSARERSTCSRVSRSSAPMCRPRLARGTATSLSILAWQVCARPFACVGSIDSRNSGASILVVDSRQTTTLSISSNSSAWTINAGRGFPL